MARKAWPATKRCSDPKCDGRALHEGVKAFPGGRWRWWVCEKCGAARGMPEK